MRNSISIWKNYESSLAQIVNGMCNSHIILFITQIVRGGCKSSYPATGVIPHLVVIVHPQIHLRERIVWIILSCNPYFFFFVHYFSFHNEY